MIYFFIIFQPSSESSSGRDNVITNNNNSGGGEGSHMILEESDHMAVVSVHAFLQVRYITSIFQEYSLFGVINNFFLFFFIIFVFICHTISFSFFFLISFNPVQI